MAALSGIYLLQYVTLPNLSQTLPVTEDQVFKHEPMEPILFQVTKESLCDLSV